jgi:DNA polymerase/3'-5' exonuclease PolX
MRGSPNKDLIIELQVLMDEARLGSDPNDKFRVKSYKTAIEKISLMSTKITGESDIPLTKGGKIYIKVLEFLEKGHIGKTREILATNENIIDIYRDLQKIAEVGPVKAKELVETHCIRSIDELKCRQELLNDKQKIGLKYWETDSLRIPRSEIKKHEKIYEAAITLSGSISDITFSINGSYRRCAKDSGDIDILVTHPQNNMSTFRVFVDRLLSQGYLIDTLAYGEKKYMGYGKLFSAGSIPRRIDIIYCPPHEYPFAQLYFTGCGTFNVKMREYASGKGYRLNEKGLVDLKTEHFVLYKFNEEKDIFQYLGLSFVEPKDRIETYKFV